MGKVRFQVFIDDATVENLRSAAGSCKGGPKDLADNHDKYLYGISRGSFKRCSVLAFLQCLMQRLAAQK